MIYEKRRPDIKVSELNLNYIKIETTISRDTLLTVGLWVKRKADTYYELVCFEDVPREYAGKETYKRATLELGIIASKLHDYEGSEKEISDIIEKLCKEARKEITKYNECLAFAEMIKRS